MESASQSYVEGLRSRDLHGKERKIFMVVGKRLKIRRKKKGSSKKKKKKAVSTSCG